MKPDVKYGLPLPAMTRLDGNKVFLRQAALEDWAEWSSVRAESRAFLTPWEQIWAPDTLGQDAYDRRIRRIHAEWREDEGYSFNVFEKPNGRLVGGIGLTQIRRGIAQSATLGYWVGERFARQGYTSEGVRLVLALAFRRLGLHRVEAACIPDNTASRVLLEKQGFRQEGFAHSYLKIAGAWADHLLYAIVEDEWQGRQTGKV